MFEQEKRQWLQGWNDLKVFMVAKACNAPNLLTIPFSRSLAA
jgi:hypothetical protein